MYNLFEGILQILRTLDSTHFCPMSNNWLTYLYKIRGNTKMLVANYTEKVFPSISDFIAIILRTKKGISSKAVKKSYAPSVFF